MSNDCIRRLSSLIVSDKSRQTGRSKLNAGKCEWHIPPQCRKCRPTLAETLAPNVEGQPGIRPKRPERSGCRRTGTSFRRPCFGSAPRVSVCPFRDEMREMHA